MTRSNEMTDKAINDARALLNALLASDWREVHVRSGEAEVFIARDGGSLNPMRAIAPTPLTSVAAHSVAEPLSRGADTPVTAPHVASLVDVLPVGTVVCAGQVVATLRVLEDRQSVEAPVSGTIVSVSAAPGVLLDYKAPIVSIAQTA